MVSASMELHVSNIFLSSMIFIDLTIDKPRKQKSYFDRMVVLVVLVTERYESSLSEEANSVCK